jgi:hypothetical protein
MAVGWRTALPHDAARTRLGVTSRLNEFGLRTKALRNGGLPGIIFTHATQSTPLSCRTHGASADSKKKHPHSRTGCPKTKEATATRSLTPRFSQAPEDGKHARGAQAQLKHASLFPGSSRPSALPPSTGRYRRGTCRIAYGKCDETQEEYRVLQRSTKVPPDRDIRTGIIGGK